MIASGSIFTVLLIYQGIIKFPKLTERDIKRNESCSSNRIKSAYAEEIKSIHIALQMDLSQLPEWSSFREARAQCTSGKLNLIKQEKRLLKCYLSVRNRIKDLPKTSWPDLVKIESCAEVLCSRDLPHLYSLCRRL